MTKEELVHLTLKQLIESLETTPENFKLEDPEFGSSNSSFPGPTIIWQYKVEIEANRYIPDPLNTTKTIIVHWNKLAKQLSCQIYNREINNLNHAVHADVQAVVILHEWLPLPLNRSYRQFMKLRKELIRLKHEKEFLDYIKKLNSIFPSTHTDELLK